MLRVVDVCVKWMCLVLGGCCAVCEMDVSSVRGILCSDVCETNVSSARGWLCSEWLMCV